MITLHAFGRVHPAVHGETRDLRVLWALEEMGLPYRVHGLDHTGGETKGEAFSAISPFHQIPILDDDGFVLSESAAILLHLAEKSGRLIPADTEGRQRVTQWCFAALSTVETPLAMIQLIDGGVMGEATSTRAFMVSYAQRVLDGVERRLQGRAWIACEDFTVADILLASVLREVRKTDLMEPFPNVRDFYARALARPAWKRALSQYADRLGADANAIA
ncbi:MAG: glutathione S-transferase family protein [Polyangiales bacterium]